MKASLDCELLWGVPDASKFYIENNIANASRTLIGIIGKWSQCSGELGLAFVGKAIPIGIMGGSVDQQDALRVFHKDAFLFSRTDLIYGFHGLTHEFMGEMSALEIEDEFRGLEEIADKSKDFRGLFVFPKNLVNTSAEKYVMKFDRVRVNSRSWLYRSQSSNVSTVKRIFRFLDSFLPIFEFFCDKRTEVDWPNAILGTHFYRANLSGPLMTLHVLRLRFGIWYMKRKGLTAHLWSHPHNFNNQQRAISNFIELAKSI